MSDHVNIENDSVPQTDRFDKEFEDALHKMECLKEERRKKRTRWLQKHNRLKKRFLVGEE